MAEREVRLKFSAEGAERTSNAISKIGSVATRTARSAKNLGSSAVRATKAFASFGQRIRGLPTDLLSTAKILQGIGQTLRGLTADFAKSGDAILEQRSAFAALEDRIGSAGKLLEQLRKATGGTTDSLTLLQGATRFAAAGVDLSAKQFQELFRVVEQVTRITGRDFVGTLDAVARSIASGTASQLVQIGLLDEASASILAQNAAQGKLEGGITTIQKRQGILNAIIEGGARQFQRLGGGVESAGKQFERALAGLTNFTNAIREGFATSQELSNAIEEVQAVLQEFGLVGEDTGLSIGKFLGDALAKIITLGLDAAELFLNLGADLSRFSAKALITFGQITRTVTDFGATLIEVLGRVFGELGPIILAPIRLAINQILLIEAATGVIPDAFAESLRETKDVLDKLPQAVKESAVKAASELRAFGFEAQEAVKPLAEELNRAGDTLDALQRRVEEARTVGRARAPGALKIEVEVDGEIDIRAAAAGLGGIAEEAARQFQRKIQKPLEEVVAEQQLLIGLSAGTVGGAVATP